MVSDYNFIILKIQHGQRAELNGHTTSGRCQAWPLLAHQSLQHGVVCGLELVLQRAGTLPVTEASIELLRRDDPLSPADEVKVHFEVPHLALLVTGRAVPTLPVTAGTRFAARLPVR